MQKTTMLLIVGHTFKLQTRARVHLFMVESKYVMYITHSLAISKNPLELRYYAKYIVIYLKQVKSLTDNLKLS